LSELEAEFDKLESSLSDIAAAGDRRATRDAGRRYAELKPLVDAYRAWRAATEELAEAQSLLKGETDPEMKAMVEAEVATLDSKIAGLHSELTAWVRPRDTH